MPHATRCLDVAASKRRRGNAPSVVLKPAARAWPMLTLPGDLHELILQCLAVSDIGELSGLQQQSRHAFKRSYKVHFFATFCKPIRLGGQLQMRAARSSLQTTQATSEIVNIGVDVPLDWAAKVPQRELAGSLLAALPLPKSAVWSAAIVMGFTFSKPRGTAKEFQNSMASVDPQFLEVVSATDHRAIHHMPTHIFNQSRLNLLHLPCELDLPWVQKFRNKPEALYAEFWEWADVLPSLPAEVETIGDLHLDANGLDDWNEGILPVKTVRQLGLNVRTSRDQVTWTPADVLRRVLATFPNLKRVGTNLEFTYGHDSANENILLLIQAFIAAGIEVVLGEVVLVKLPSSSKRRNASLDNLAKQLGAIDGCPFVKPRAKTMKDNNGYLQPRVPAALMLRLTPVMQNVIADSMWKSVW
eukprot:CAMPEP_0172688010 /NCGR_PEP_ID=MMETSP1074-20121228/22103_1 /TAXON_ID=2916 /ORGANISM="Ceratium fusus, Strain PA161109" /LENGTH=414 /DNA_ID=CAMNT_0013507567 /DNA_START=31 /DNA_END=1275 /DNA_ORIENTATION=-